MAAPLLAAAALGSALQAYGEYQQGKADAAYLREKSQISLLEADEQLNRAAINTQQIIREGKKFSGDQVAQFAASGVDISSNATLATLQDTSSVISDQIYKTQREAEFEAFMKRKEAYSYERAAQDTTKASRIKSLSTILGGSAKVADGLK